MAVVTKVRRLANPRRRKSASKKRTSGRRRVTAKRARNGRFVKKAKTTVKRRRNTAKTSRVVARPKRRKAKATRRRRTRRSSNPALIVTLGAVNPRKRKRSKNKMARKTKKRSTRRRARAANPKRRRRTRSRNTRIVVVAPRRNRKRRSSRRRSNPRGRRRSVRRYRRNPAVFGASGTKIATMVLGGLVGVAATKFLPTLVPSLPGGNMVRAAVSIAAAFVAGYLAKRFVPSVGDAVLFGGLMQAGSVALNAFLPSVGSRIALSGMGDLVDGRFAVPQNPIRNGGMIAAPPAPTPTNARVTVNGLHRAYQVAY